MSYQKDLSIHQYSPCPYGPVLAVGWLDKDHPFTVGEVPLSVFDRIDELLKTRENIVSRMRGIHILNIKKPPLKETDFLKRYGNPPSFPLATGEFHFLKDGVYYAAPVMVYEYMRVYGYRPPVEFLDAVLFGEIITENQHFELLRQRDIDNGIIESSPEGQKMKQYLTQAEQLIEKKQRQKALKFIDDALKLYPLNPYGLFLAANTHFDLKQYTESQQYLDKLIHDCSDVKIAYALNGMNQFHLGNYRQAKQFLNFYKDSFEREDFEDESEERHNLTQIYYYLGRVHEKIRDWPQAAHYHSLAGSYTPDDQEISKRLRTVLLKKRLAKFLPFYRKRRHY